MQLKGTILDHQESSQHILKSQKTLAILSLILFNDDKVIWDKIILQIKDNIQSLIIQMPGKVIQTVEVSLLYETNSNFTDSDNQNFLFDFFSHDFKLLTFEDQIKLIKDSCHIPFISETLSDILVDFSGFFASNIKNIDNIDSLLKVFGRVIQISQSDHEFYLKNIGEIESRISSLSYQIEHPYQLSALINFLGTSKSKNADIWNYLIESLKLIDFKIFDLQQFHELTHGLIVADMITEEILIKIDKAIIKMEVNSSSFFNILSIVYELLIEGYEIQKITVLKVFSIFDDINTFQKFHDVLNDSKNIHNLKNLIIVCKLCLDSENYDDKMTVQLIIQHVKQMISKIKDQNSKEEIKVMQREISIIDNLIHSM